MSDSEEEKGGSGAYRVTRLKGQENYAEWEFSVLSVLLAKDMIQYLEESPRTESSTKQEQKFNREYRKTYAILVQSLSTIVQSSLSATARNPLDTNVKTLWAELKSSYSAVAGARQDSLLHNMWTTPIVENEDPLPQLARNKSAHAQINAGGENLSDRMLAYAMAIALPDSFNTMKQALWLQEAPTSTAVSAAIQAEWTRRQSDEATGSALAARLKTSSSGRSGKPPSSSSRPFLAQNYPSLYCDEHQMHGHSTENSYRRAKRLAKEGGKDKGGGSA
jgi:hypothetical protein